QAGSETRPGGGFREGVGSRKQEDRRGLSSTPKVRQDFHAAAPWQQDVKNEAVGAVCEGEAVAFLARGRGQDLVPIALDATSESLQNLAFIFNDEDARHDRPPALFCLKVACGGDC